MSRRSASSLILLSSQLVALGAMAAEVDEEGKRLYQVHCLACHGESGRGDGPMRDQLDLDVPDLTTIATRHGGAFPVDVVHQIIDGRYESPVHGSRKMPVWGFTFQSAGSDSDQEGEVQEMVAALARFLESLQANAEEHVNAGDSQD